MSEEMTHFPPLSSGLMEWMDAAQKITTERDRALARITELETKQRKVERRLQQFARAWEESGSDDLLQTDLGNELVKWSEKTFNFKETP